MADLSYRLATIKTDVALDITPEQLTLGASNNDQLTEYFGRYEFKRWLNEVMNGADSITNNNEQPTKINHYQATLRSLKTIAMKHYRQFKLIVAVMKPCSPKRI